LEKGGFSSLLKNSPAGPQVLDLNTYLPTLTRIGKLDIKVEWVVDGVIPALCITTLTAPGGVFKTYVCLQLGTCVESGRPFIGLKTQKMPVYYVDFENPWPF
jgi:hypothetical protein